MSQSHLKTLKLEASSLYKPLWLSDKRYIISIGGRGGARSYEASQKIIANLEQTDRKFRAAIMREIHADIRHSIWQECVDRVYEHGLEGDIHLVDTTMEMFKGNNSVHAHGFRKSSSERTAKLKSLAGYTDAYIEEGEEISETDFLQLDDSLRVDGSHIHMALNTPARTHWVIRRWFDLFPVEEAPGFYSVTLKKDREKDTAVIFSDHTKNPYLNRGVHERYESYRLTKPAYYWHMIRGLSPETVTGRIYTGWREIPEIPHEARFVGYGLDFGYDPDPAAVVAVYYWNGGYILDEKLYKTKMIDDELATSFEAWKSGIIVADSAEPKAIEGLRRRNLNVVGAEKGKDSVEFGIKHVQGMRISYTESSKNLKNEYENYAWKRTKEDIDEDQHRGIEDPACSNHLMSAARYALTTLVKPTQERDYYDVHPADYYQAPNKPQSNPA